MGSDQPWRVAMRRFRTGLRMRLIRRRDHAVMGAEVVGGEASLPILLIEGEPFPPADGRVLPQGSDRGRARGAPPGRVLAPSSDRAMKDLSGPHGPVPVSPTLA